MEIYVSDRREGGLVTEEVFHDDKPLKAKGKPLYLFLLNNGGDGCRRLLRSVPPVFSSPSLLGKKLFLLHRERGHI